MTVRELIGMLQKVEDKDALVYLRDSSTMKNECGLALLEQDLDDDVVCVVLKDED
jgi:hypothetical protein